MTWRLSLESSRGSHLSRKMNTIDNMIEMLKKYQNISYTCDAYSLTVHPADEEGFPVSLSLEEEGYTLCFGDWHDHFEAEEEALEFFAFGLSHSCRLRVISRGGHPYKWIVENLANGTWRIVYEAGLFFFRFWGKKEEAVFQNKLIKI